MARKKTKVPTTISTVVSNLKGEVPSECIQPAEELLRVLPDVSEGAALFCGNGISRAEIGGSPSASILGTEELVKGYAQHIAETDPGKSDRYRSAAERLRKIYQRDDTEADMTGLMQIFKQINSGARDFVDYVIERCCTAEPSWCHFEVLLLASLLKLLGPKAFLIAFTTNYDNLLERAYLHKRTFQNDLAFVGFTGSPGGSGGVSPFYGPATTASNPVTFPDGLLRPLYTFTSSLDANSIDLPIVPLHGSIRVSWCSHCGRELQSGTATIGVKRCAYCGKEVSDVILPTAEGGANQAILELLERVAAMTRILVFVGYGFDDTDIKDRLRFALKSRANSDKDTLIINVCRGKFPSDMMISDRISVLNVPVDIGRGLGAINFMLGKDCRSSFLSNLACAIFHKMVEGELRHPNFEFLISWRLPSP